MANIEARTKYNELNKLIDDKQNTIRDLIFKNPEYYHTTIKALKEEVKRLKIIRDQVRVQM